MTGVDNLFFMTRFHLDDDVDDDLDDDDGEFDDEDREDDDESDEEDDEDEDDEEPEEWQVALETDSAKVWLRLDFGD